MDNSAFLDALRRDGAAFRASVASVSLEAPAASCPGWTVADLAWHLTEVHQFWGSIVQQRARNWEQVDEAERVPDDELLTTYDATFERLLQALSTTDSSTEVWTWSEQQDVAFVVRRMAQETAVHRWDADQAAGHPIGIEPNLASDGIDEFLTHFLPRVSESAEPVAGSVHIHCGDVPGEWTIRPGADEGTGGYSVAREHAKGDCALRGDASDLLLALWRRVGPEAVDIVGNAGVATRFLAATNLE